MSFHTNFEEYQKISEPENCPVCLNLPMPEGMVDIVELEHSTLTAEAFVCLKGTSFLCSKVHVIEPFEMEDSVLFAYIKEVMICAKALKKVTGAVKINYEIHGNTVPHLHTHLFPRYRDDPFPGMPINYHLRKDQYGSGEFERFVEEMRREIELLRSKGAKDRGN